jgi:hypothetical protein
MTTIEESKNRDIIRPDEYNDALTEISEYGFPILQVCLFDDFLVSLIARSRRVAERLQRRNLFYHTWNTGDISSEIRKLNEEVQNYLSVHVVGNVYSLNAPHCA